MKQREVEEILKQHGFVFLRYGKGSHHVWNNGIRNVVVPKQVDRNPTLVKAILKQAGIRL